VYVAGPAAFLLLCCFFAWLSLPSPVSARQWHVRSDASNGGTGSAWNPFRTLQQGVDNAWPGDTVLVHQGAYYESVHTVRSGVDSTDGVIYYITILGAGDGPALVKARYDQCFWIYPEHDYLWIEGLHMTQAYMDTTAHGAAIRTFGDYGVFLRNFFYDVEMGVFSEGWEAVLEEENNRGNYIAHNVFSDAAEAAVRLKHSSENEVAFNLFYHNSYAIEPVGAVTYYCGLGNRVMNNTFWNNAGPAVMVYNGTGSEYCIPSGASEVRDNIFARPDPGPLFEVQEKTAEDTTSIYSHNLFWGPDSGSQVVIWGCDEWGQGGLTWTVNQFVLKGDSLNSQTGEGTFFADPLFEDPWNLAFDLLPGSPAIDAGSRSAVQAGADSLTAVVSQALDAGPVDLGYHHPPEIYQVNPPLDLDPGLVVYPNPYNGSGGLHFTLPNVGYPRRITGGVYDVRGRKVTEFRLPDEPFNQYSLPWDAKNMPSGIYLLRMTIDGSVTSSRILLLK